MIVRIAFAAASGITVTLLLLFLMQLLIRFDIAPAGPMHTPFFDPASVRVPIEPPKKEEDPRYESLRQRVAPAPTRPGLPVFEPLTPVLTAGTTPLPPLITDAASTTGAYDAPLVTVMSVEPVYPARASAQGLEGFVTVRFDVEPEGTVTNVTVVEASHPIFERSAVRALARFRFKARVVDGVPQPSLGLERRFVYRMERS